MISKQWLCCRGCPFRRSVASTLAVSSCLSRRSLQTYRRQQTHKSKALCKLNKTANRNSVCVKILLLWVFIPFDLWWKKILFFFFSVCHHRILTEKPWRKWHSWTVASCHQVRKTLVFIPDGDPKHYTPLVTVQDDSWADEGTESAAWRLTGTAPQTSFGPPWRLCSGDGHSYVSASPGLVRGDHTPTCTPDRRRLRGGSGRVKESHSQLFLLQKISKTVCNKNETVGSVNKFTE